MYDLYFLAFTFVFLTINPAALLLCLGLSVVIGEYRVALPAGAILQLVLAFGIGGYAPGIIIAVAALSGALLASLGVMVRKKIINPRRRTAE